MTFTVIIMEKLFLPECLWHNIPWMWMHFILKIVYHKSSYVNLNIWCRNLKIEILNYRLLKNAEIMIQVYETNFWKPIIWDLTFEISTPIVEIDCIWLHVVNNSNNKVCLDSNNAVSGAFWKKKFSQDNDTTAVSDLL